MLWKREGLRDGSETCCDVRFGDAGTDKKEEVELEMVRFHWG